MASAAATAEAAMAAPSASGRRSMSWGSSISQSFRQAEADDPFGRAASQQGHDDDEENLRWAALEKLPTYDRMRRGVIRTALLQHDGCGAGAGGAAPAKDDGGRMELVDIQKLAAGNLGRALLDRVFQDDSERFLRRLRDRIDMYVVSTRAFRSIIAIAMDFVQSFIEIDGWLVAGWGSSCRRSR